MAWTDRRAGIEQAAFRSRSTGQVIATGPCHDITRLPGGLDADLGEWQAGFTDAAMRFLDRREAAEALGLSGRLESRAYLAGDAEPTLEAGHLEAWLDPDRRERPARGQEAAPRSAGTRRHRPSTRGRAWAQPS